MTTPTETKRALAASLRALADELERPMTHSLVVAPTRSGKTSKYVIPTVLEHPGPVIVTARTPDIVEHTLEHRQQRGDTYIWDPYGPRSDIWNPLHGCQSWHHAQQVSEWLTSALFARGGVCDYFLDDAKQLLAPLLHAAAVDNRTIADVSAWLERGDLDEAEAVLRGAATPGATTYLAAINTYNEATRADIICTAARFVRARANHIAKAMTPHAGCRQITPEALLGSGEANTLYIVADRHRTSAAFTVTLLSSLLHHITAGQESGRPQDPCTLFALDDYLDTAALRDLPQCLSVALPSARFLTVWQSDQQILDAYGRDAASAILTLSGHRQARRRNTTARAPVRQAVLAALSPSEARTSTDVAKITGINANTVGATIHRLVRDGEAAKAAGRGYLRIAG